MITQPSPTDPAAIDQAWSQLQAEAKGHLMPATAAEQLGVSEAALIASRIGQGTTRLRLDVKDLLTAMGELGTVKAVTRNPHVVHERHGVYSKVVVEPPVHGMVLDPGIDLRIILPNWAHALAVVAQRGERTSRSIQFFDPAGTAVHKAFCLSDDQAAAFDAIVARFAAEDQDPTFATSEAKSHPKGGDGIAVDPAAFEAEWRAMTDPHQFFGLLRKHGLDKRQANRLVPDELARRVTPGSLRQVLTSAAEREVPLMVFVGNGGCIQIHTGPVRKVVDARGWLNVLDPEFDLHVKEEAIAEAWAVTKPAEGGREVHSIECFDAEGTTLISIFGQRKPGTDELDGWRTIHADLPSQKGDE